jgi:hypothetical protein
MSGNTDQLKGRIKEAGCANKKRPPEAKGIA